MGDSSLQAVVEATFSPINLEKDKYLLSKMDAERYVPLTVISKFPKISSNLPTSNSQEQNISLLSEMVKKSTKLEFQQREEGACVRGRTEKPQDTTPASTPAATTEEQPARVQSLWRALTQPSNDVDERLFTVEELLSAPYDLEKLSEKSKQNTIQPLGTSPHPGSNAEGASEGLRGVLGAVLRAPASPQATQFIQAQPSAEASPSNNTYKGAGGGESWADRSERRRQLFAKTQGYNKGLIRVHMSKGPDDTIGFSAGRGRPIGGMGQGSDFN